MKQKLLLTAVLISSWAMHSQWATQNSGFTTASRGIDEIKIVDANTVWGKGYDGTTANANVQIFTRTTNGGTSWTTGTINVGNTAFEITNIIPVSGTTAWAGAVHPTNGRGGVWKTTNGGTSWTKQNTTAYSASSSFFNVVHFFDANNGITEGDAVSGEFEVYRTTDGGTTWSPIPAASLPDPIGDEYGYNGGNIAAGNSFWFVTSKGKLYRTTDMGVTWTKLDTPINDFSGTAVGGQIFFSDNNNGILIARSTVGTGETAVNTFMLHKTTDGGATWSSGTSYTVPYRSLAYINGTTVLIGTGTADDVASTAYSNDNGTTWTQIDTGVQRVSVAFLNGTTGWASGFTTVTGGISTGGVYKYTGASLGIEDIASNKTFKVYPNPANNQLNLSGASINEVAVYDLLGKQVLTQKFSAQDQVSLNVSGLETGMYVLTATNDSGAKETIKFAKQ